MNRALSFGDIQAIVLDVDGVLTDGRLLITEEGRLLRTMHTRDGFAIKYALSQGWKIGIITGGNSAGVRQRLEGLGIQSVFMGVADKLPVLQQLVASWGLQAHEVAYMGDDLPDYACMKWSGLAICPADAASEIQILSDLITVTKGGGGCVRELIECMMKERGVWKQSKSPF